MCLPRKASWPRIEPVLVHKAQLDLLQTRHLEQDLGIDQAPDEARRRLGNVKILGENASGDFRLANQVEVKATILPA